MKLILATLISISAFGSDFNFDVDGLCFKNGTEELREFGPLGRLGDKKGVCQGMSGIVSGFHESAIFNPAIDQLSESEAFQAIEEVVEKHSSGCKGARVIIGGYSNLQEFCRDFKKLFLSKSIKYNTDIALREIVPHYMEFQRVKKEPVTNVEGLKKIHEAVESIKKKLSEGRWPLMLYFSHVVSVHSVQEVVVDGKLQKVIFGIYDSNFATTIQYEVPYVGELPAPQKMIWEITPKRSRGDCDK